MTTENLLKIARKIMGARFLIIDEISLLGTKNILKIDNTLKQALLAWFYDPQRNRRTTKENTNILKNIKTLPFGGLHVLFSGYKFA